MRCTNIGALHIFTSCMPLFYIIIFTFGSHCIIMEVIKLENVSKSYGRIKAVDHLNLSVEEGEIYGFIGPNGAGKSTTIRLLLNYLRADSGEISVLGFSPKTQETQIKKLSGYVPADTFMYNDMKVSDLFRFTESFHKINANERMKTLVDVLDIDLNKKFEQLSFGNRKKVSIACALLHKPKLIILDEPSNGLDPVIRTRLYDLLKNEQKQGATIFFSSHVLSEVQKFCSRIGLLKEGKLIRETTAEDFTNVGYLQVSVETDKVIDLNTLKGVAGIEKHNSTVRFIYSGDPNQLIKYLSSLDLHSVHIEEPDLENVFMHYFS
jgi:ABC-2 type transport system ATP-binding protein